MTTFDSGEKLANCDGQGVKPDRFIWTLRKSVKLSGLDPNNYHSHSLRIGRACDMMKGGMEVSDIKQLGHWQSN